VLHYLVHPFQHEKTWKLQVTTATTDLFGRAIEVGTQSGKWMRNDFRAILWNIQ
jgi:hypothetical protein